MTNLGPSRIVAYLFFGILMAATSWAQTQRAPILEKVAKTYGIDSFDKVEAIRYTWSGEVTGVFKLSRTWEWEPKTNKVTYEGKDKDGKPGVHAHTVFALQDGSTRGGHLQSARVSIIAEIFVTDEEGASAITNASR